MKKNDFVFNGYYVMFAVFGLHVDHLVMLLLTLMTAETHRMLSVNWMVCSEELCCWNVIELKSKLKCAYICIFATFFLSANVLLFFPHVFSG